MITAKMIEVSTVPELQHEINRIAKKINEKTLEIHQLKYALNELKIAACEKDGGHNFELDSKDHHGFETYKCKCGAMRRG